MSDVHQAIVHGNQVFEPIFEPREAVVAIYVDSLLSAGIENRSNEELQREYSRIQQSNLPQLHRIFGAGFVNKGEFSMAKQALEKCCQPEMNIGKNTYLRLAISEMRLQNYMRAIAHIETSKEQFEALNSTASAGDKTDTTKLDEAINTLAAINRKKRFALIVGIDKYQDADIPNQRGAENDAIAMKKLLTEHCDFADEDVTLLINENATRHRVLGEFNNLLRLAEDAIGIFYFAGCGSSSAAGQPTLVTADGRKGLVFDISLVELAELAGRTPNNLVSIFDVGWSGDALLPWAKLPGSRYMKTDERNIPLTRDLVRNRAQRRATIQESRQIGRAAPAAWTPTIAGEWKRTTDWDETRMSIEEELRKLQIGRVSCFNVSLQSCLLRYQEAPLQKKRQVIVD